MRSISLSSNFYGILVDTNQTQHIQNQQLERRNNVPECLHAYQLCHEQKAENY